MKRILFTMVPDSDGRITVTETIKYIRENISEIKVPNVDITIIPLALLTLSEDKTKHCIEGYADKKIWEDGICTQYEFTLIFA